MEDNWKLEIIVRIGRRWHYGLGEQIFAAEGPIQCIESFAYRCGDVMASLIIRALRQAEVELERIAEEEKEDEQDG